MTQKKNQKKPEPYGRHKIWAHPNGQWAKKKNGRVYYLGPWDDPKAAELEWQRVLATLDEKKAPASALTVRDLCDRYFDHKEEQGRRGEITPPVVKQAQRACETTWETLGDTLLDDTTVDDFRRLRKAISDDLAPTTVNLQLMNLRAIWNFGTRNGLLKGTPPWGDHLRDIPRRNVRVYKEEKRATQGEKFFEVEEVRSLIEFADDEMKAAVLVCLNCAYGPSDLLHLGRRNVEGRWARLHRNKTGIARTAYLWPETLAALEKIWTEDSIFSYRPDSDGHLDLSQPFRELCMAARCHRKQRGIYALRSTFRTVADSTGDIVVINEVMGHVDNSMGAVYRQHVDPERHIRVSDHVRSWYLDLA